MLWCLHKIILDANQVPYPILHCFNGLPCNLLTEKLSSTSFSYGGNCNWKQNGMLDASPVMRLTGPVLRIPSELSRWQWSWALCMLQEPLVPVLTEYSHTPPPPQVSPPSGLQRRPCTELSNFSNPDLGKQWECHHRLYGAIHGVHTPYCFKQGLHIVNLESVHRLVELEFTLQSLTLKQCTLSKLTRQAHRVNNWSLVYLRTNGCGTGSRILLKKGVGLGTVETSLCYRVPIVLLNKPTFVLLMSIR